jgi:serine/threonine protein kinase
MLVIEGCTPTYASPEVLKEGKMGRASDVYSFGIIMWVIHTGETPYCHKKLGERELRAAVIGGK